MKSSFLSLALVFASVAVACGKGESGAPAGGDGGDGDAASGGRSDSATGGSLDGGGGQMSTGGGETGGDAGVTGGAGGTGGASSGGNGAGGSLGGAGSGGASATSDCRDVFGATEFFQTASSGLEWTSEYWASAAHAVEFGTADPADPLGLANRRGTGDVTVGGDGTLSMTGSQPRLYLATMEEHPWLNVEVTIYYQRLEDDDTAYAGLVVGARGGPNGHGNENCTATTYYARMRHDGRVDLAKELEHPTALARETTAIWPNDGPLPHNQWIGMKYIVRNDEMGGVRLQVFRDLTEGADGGTWEPLIDSTDDGGWAPSHNCSFEPDHIILEGGGVVFIRNTGTTGPGSMYRNFTVREINPNRPCASN